ncbi:MAG: DNA methyltransferase, partial [Caulobacteraceae bacterium]
MPPSWNDIRARAAAFAREWADARYERGESQSFYNDFFEVFGLKRRRVASFEEPVRKLGDRRGFIDLFWKGTLLVEQKSAGRSLEAARAQALDYFPGLKDYELPRYVLACDFQTFDLLDIETGEAARFALADLPANVERFGFIVGVEKRVFRDQDPVNILAAEAMGKLHDALKDSGYAGHALERLLVRLLFCLFADDTGIFERGAMEDWLQRRTGEDGADLGPALSQFFQVLNTPTEKRQNNLDEDLAAFPYINGDLFAEALPIASFDRAMRARLLEVCGFHWETISPAIFGALFQSVMKPAERRAKGAHYTTERNILKVIEPLFLDDLRAELARLKGRRDTGRAGALRAFHDRLAGLTFFDPACGCGNFLVIAYRELRALEIELLKALHPAGQRDLAAGSLSRLDVDRFYGVEIDEFPARIAETALWMMDHIMNVRLGMEFGQVFARIPLKAAPHIVNADALEIDWADVLAAEHCAYVFGNPPFLGQSFQTPEQRAQMGRIVNTGGRGGSLDYVTAWFLKASVYVKGATRIGFVATNSITQGEQVAQLWPLLFERGGLEIAFAHRTFAWGSDARGMAHVHVVVIGLAKRGEEPAIKRLFSYVKGGGDPVESLHARLSPYLIDASSLADPHLVVREATSPLIARARLRMGSKLVEGGRLIFNADQRAAFLAREPTAAPYLCPLVGSEEYINGGERWIISVDGVAPELIRALPGVAGRLAAVRDYRKASKKAQTRELADFP